MTMFSPKNDNVFKLYSLAEHIKNTISPQFLDFMILKNEKE